MPVEPALDFAVLGWNEQEVMVSVLGEDVVRFDQSPPVAVPKRERMLPDPVRIFVEAAQLGMFTESSTPPWKSGAELIGKEVRLATSQQSWRVRVRNLHCGAFRILANMLRARLLDNITLKTISQAGSLGAASAPIDLAGLPYPAPHKPVGFVVDYEMPERTSRDRYLQFTFVREPDDAQTQVIFGGLESWTWLMMLGGYPGEKMHPNQSAAVPEPAFLLAPRTIEQAFPDLFLCDDDCYAAVINYAQVIHRSICPLELLLIR